jgi:membrane protein YdbS with pleckstrin-like domain
MSVLTVRPSLKPVLPWYLLCVFSTAYLLYLYVNHMLANPLLGLVPLLLLLRAAIGHVRTRLTSLTIGGGRLRMQQGLFSHSTRTMELLKVQDVRVDRTIWQRLFGTGDLTIETAGETSRLTIHNIDHAEYVGDRILKASRRQDEYPTI